MAAELIALDWYDPDMSILAGAARILRAGGLVAFPTETVYGLGANALDEDAVLSIFRAKGRPSDNPLIVHVSSEQELTRIVSSVTPVARKLIRHFWPGPLTLVLSSQGNFPPIVTAGLDTVAVRMPSNKIARDLIRLSGVPVAAPSANRSGRPSPTDAAAVLTDLGEKVDIILDAGPTHVGVESTVVDVTEDRVVLLRPGGTSLEDIEKVAGPVVTAGCPEKAKASPGTRYRHYAPLVPLFLWEEDGTFWDSPPCDINNAGYVGMIAPPVTVADRIIFSGLEEYARGLFSALRELEGRGVKTIIAQMPSSEGLGMALRDRLKRASGR